MGDLLGLLLAAVLVLGVRLSRPTLAASWPCDVARLVRVGKCSACFQVRLDFRCAHGELWAWQGEGLQGEEERVAVAESVVVVVVGRR